MNIYPELQDKKCPETKIISKNTFIRESKKSSLLNGIIQKTITILLALLFVIIVFG